MFEDINNKKIASLKDRKLFSDKETISLIYYTMCKTFHWDYYTFNKQPIPFIIEMLKIIQKEHRETDRSLRKAKRKKR